MRIEDNTPIEDIDFSWAKPIPPGTKINFSPDVHIMGTHSIWDGSCTNMRLHAKAWWNYCLTDWIDDRIYGVFGLKCKLNKHAWTPMWGRDTGNGVMCHRCFIDRATRQPVEF